MSFAMVLSRRHGDTSAVHEDDLPGACLFLEESRLQPLLVYRAGGICDPALVDVGDPSGVAADVNVGFGHVPFVALAREVLGLDEGHDGVSVESGTSIEDIKVRPNDGIELRKIVCAGCSEYRAHCVYDLRLLGREFQLGPRSRDARRKH
jgi:hypothetical protein